MNKGDVKDESDENTIDFTKKTWREDITFVVDGKRLYAAKNVLAMVSPVFETMFSSPFKEKDQEEISLPEKKFDEFHEFLKCVYPSLKDIDKENVFMVLPLADEYQVPSLKKRCGEFLLNYLKSKSSQMDKSEILRCYSMGYIYNIVGIGELCINQMCLHSQVELGENDVKHIDKDTLVKYYNDMSAHFRGLHTKYINLVMKVSANLERTEAATDFENSIGIRLEHTIANILVLSTKRQQSSKEVSVWNVKFRLKTYIIKECFVNYMAVFLHCDLPRDSSEWTCKVDARMLLTVGKGEKIVESHELNTCFKRKEAVWGFNKFIKMSDLVAALNFDDDDEKTVKIVAYLLVDKPVQELLSTSS